MSIKKLLTLVVAWALVACATSKNPNDPYEAYNRKMFTFNMAMDHYVLRPVTVGYTYIPEPIRYAITNFYNNLRDFVTLGDDILQLEGEASMHTTMRIAINSTFGIAGLIDVSSSLGLPQTQNTFGNTLKRWGWANSNYFLVPFLGPGTVRDQLGIVPDLALNPTWYLINDNWISAALIGINQVDTRSKYLDQDQLLMQTLDPYATIRDIYLQKNGQYKYPSESSSKDQNSDLDNLIDAENGESSSKLSVSKSTAAGGNNIDELIDEENGQAAQTTIATSAAAINIESGGFGSASSPASKSGENASSPLKQSAAMK